jgi:hypothetical protein
MHARVSGAPRRENKIKSKDTPPPLQRVSSKIAGLDVLQEHPTYHPGMLCESCQNQVPINFVETRVLFK